MNSENICLQLDRIRKLVYQLTAKDGTLRGIDKRLEISLDLCESLLQEALNDPQMQGGNK